jgi:hypothetical protein
LELGEACISVQSRKMDPPREGDRILVMKQFWLDLILSGEKTMELRSRRLSPGPVWLGSKGVMQGFAILGAAVLIPDSSSYATHAEEHRCPEGTLRYKKIWGVPLQDVQRFASTVPYIHTQGAVTIVKFRSRAGEAGRLRPHMRSAKKGDIRTHHRAS